MYGLIRILICFGILIIVRRKMKNVNRKKYIICALLLLFIVGPVSMFFPIENLFITFSTPEKSYYYVNSEAVRMVIEGNTTDLVIGGDNDYVYLIVPKTDKGWKIGRGLDIKTVSVTYDEGIVTYIYQYKDSNEYYIQVENTNGQPCTIKDSTESEFYEYKDHMIHYYTYVQGLNDEYELFVNDKKIKLENIEK